MDSVETLANCCSLQPKPNEAKTLPENVCSVSGTKGKSIELITLKSLLIPAALATLDATREYYFCKTATCDIVYFSGPLSFSVGDVKVKVHQKDEGADVPVCYCFGWTPASIAQAAETGEADRIVPSISAHIKAGRCGCEVNNPQGSCCLGNVNSVVKEAQKAELTV